MFAGNPFSNISNNEQYAKKTMIGKFVYLQLVQGLVVE